jgi:hypothetical protein
VYVTKCSPVEVVPRTHPNCTEEIPVTFNGTDANINWRIPKGDCSVTGKRVCDAP